MDLLGKLRLRGGAYAVVGGGVLAVKRRVLLQRFCDGLGVGEVRVLAANLLRGGIDLGLSAYPRPTRFGGALRPEVPRFRRETLRGVLCHPAEVRADLGWHVAHNGTLYQYKSFLYKNDLV